MILVTNLGNR